MSRSTTSAVDRIGIAQHLAASIDLTFPENTVQYMLMDRETAHEFAQRDDPAVAPHEHLGGYFVIDVSSLDDTLDWAARAPCAATGSTEVRPVPPPPSAA